MIYKLHAHFLLFQFSFQFSSIANYSELFQRITISIPPSKRTQTFAQATLLPFTFWIWLLHENRANRLKKPWGNVGRTADCRVFLCLWNEKRGIWISRTSFSRCVSSRTLESSRWRRVIDALPSLQPVAILSFVSSAGLRLHYRPSLVWKSHQPSLLRFSRRIHLLAFQAHFAK